MIEIVKNIESIRNELGITQKEMGKKLGMSQQSYSQYMNVNTDLPLSLIEKIAKVYNMEIVNLIMYPQKYVPEGETDPVCDECRKKQETIDNLNELLRIYKSKKEII